MDIMMRLRRCRNARDRQGTFQVGTEDLPDEKLQKSDETQRTSLCSLRRTWADHRDAFFQNFEKGLHGAFSCNVVSISITDYE